MPRSPDRPDRPLHLVEVVPPWQSGYTVRTHELAAAQRAIGMDPAVAARPSPHVEPCYLPLTGNLSVLQHHGVTYYRRTHERRVSRWLIRSSQNLVARGVRGARRFRRVLDLPPDPWEGFVEPLARVVEATVVHAHTPAANFDGARRLARVTRLPTVYEVRGFWELPAPGQASDVTMRGLTRAQWRERETGAALEADAVITLGVAMRAELVRRGVPAEKIHIVPNGIDVNRFQQQVRKDPQLLADLALKDRFVLGYVTTVDRWEGIETVLRALRTLRSDAAEVVFVLVGSGPDLERLEGLVDRWQLGDRVRFVGRVPHGDVRRYYSLFDAFVVPRTNDEVCRLVTPLKPLEALAQQIPTIVSDLPALRELVAPGECGWSFVAEDSDDLARTIRATMAAPDKARALASHGRDWVVRERSWERLATLTREVYSSIEKALSE